MASRVFSLGFGIVRAIVFPTAILLSKASQAAGSQRTAENYWQHLILCFICGSNRISTIAKIFNLEFLKLPFSHTKKASIILRLFLLFASYFSVASASFNLLQPSISLSSAAAYEMRMQPS